MKTKALTLCVLLAATATLISQGLLTPPGPPAPVMKTLTEIEPRANLQATPPPPGVSTADPNYHYVITQPGSYYLSANLAATRKSGILISASNVTLDLNGFEISAPATGADTGIKVDDPDQQACVRNGSIRDFPSGLVASLAHSCRISGVSVSGSTAVALHTGYAAVVSSCVLRNCSGPAGITAFAGSTLTGCTLWNCAANTGIDATEANLSHCTVTSSSGSIGIHNSDGSTTDCTVTESQCGFSFEVSGTVTGCAATKNNHGTGLTAGFYCGGGTHLSHCVAKDNESGDSVLSGDHGVGFFLTENCSIDHCTADSNYGSGIRLGGNSVALDNNCTGNGAAGHSGAGIYASGVANRIEGNNLTYNTRGIELIAQRNIVVRNTARSNTSNYVIAAGNRIAQIVVPDVNAAPIADGNLGSTDGFTNVGAWANFSF